MPRRPYSRSLRFVAVCFFFASCGEMDTIISSSSSYAVDALVGNSPVSGSSVVTSSSSIRPVFSSDAARDPDSVGLRVVLLTADRQEAAQSVEYRERAFFRAASSPDADIILVDDLSDELPSFALSEGLPIGRYILLIQVLGGDGVLFEDEREIFHLGSEPCAVSALVAYPPGAGPSVEVPLFPTDTALLLQAELEAGPDIDPYLVWSFAGRSLSAAYLSEGGARLLWRTPALPGFHRVELSLYPVKPLAGEASSLKADARFITVATSPDAPVPGLPSPASAYHRIYRFLGDLSASGSAVAAPESLSARARNEPLWLPFSTGYGLAVGPLRAYLSGNAVVPGRDENGSAARVLMRASFVAEGLVFSASMGGLALALSSSAEGPVLSATLGGESVSLPASVYAPFSGEASLLEITVSWTNGESPYASLRFVLDGAFVGEGFLPVAGPFPLSGSFALGGSQSSEEPVDIVVAVVDELAFLVLPAAVPALSPTGSPGTPSGDGSAALQ